jgi:hypothetical protein
VPNLCLHPAGHPLPVLFNNVYADTHKSLSIVISSSCEDSNILRAVLPCVCTFYRLLSYRHTGLSSYLALLPSLVKRLNILLGCWFLSQVLIRVNPKLLAFLKQHYLCTNP